VSTDLKIILEALLFAAEGPLTSAQLLQVLESSDQAALEAALAALKADYADSGRAFELVEVAGGHALRTRSDLSFWIRKLKREQVTKLSRPALETLAIIAYKQPVLKAEIERLRGVEVGGVLRMLMEKDLVRVAGRKDLPGRPLIYGTTRRFLEVFDLRDLKDLPTLEEMEALAGEQGELFRGGLAQAEGGEEGEEAWEEPGEGFDEDELAREWEERMGLRSAPADDTALAPAPAKPEAQDEAQDETEGVAQDEAEDEAEDEAQDEAEDEEPVDEDGDCDPPPEAA
jgi:segregation and condensation protein B